MEADSISLFIKGLPLGDPLNKLIIMEPPKPKFNIEQNNENLKVYMFTVQGGPLQIEIAEDFKAVLAYNDQGAYDEVRKDYPAGTLIHVKKRAQVEVKKIIDVVATKTSSIPQEIKILPAPQPAKEKTIKDFIFGIMLVADKYVESERDRASLKRIIKKIKVPNNEENKGNIVA